MGEEGGRRIRTREKSLQELNRPLHEEGAMSQGMWVSLEAEKGKEVDFLLKTSPAGN